MKSFSERTNVRKSWCLVALLWIWAATASAQPGLTSQTSDTLVSPFTTRNRTLTLADQGAANRVLIAVVSAEYSASRSVSSVTYGGRPLTFLARRILSAGSNWNEVAVFYLPEAGLAAVSGATLSFTFTGGTTNIKSAGVGVFVFGDVDQTQLLQEVRTHAVTAANITLPTGSEVPTTAVGAVVFATVTSGNNSAVYTPSAGYSLIHQRGFGNHSYATSMRTVAAAGNERPGYTATASSRMTMVAFRMDVVLPPLPVRLLHFKAEANHQGTRLRWATALEVNNDYFELDYSADATHWEPLAQIDGTGNSTQRHDYSFQDPAVGSATRYYRLTQTDWDGQRQLLGYATVGPAAGGRVRVWPQPAGQHLHVQADGAVLRVDLFGMDGRRHPVVDRAEPGGRILDVSGCRPGVYALRITLADQTVLRRVQVY